MIQEFQETQAFQECRESQGFLENREFREQQVQKIRVFQVFRGFQGFRVCQVHRGRGQRRWDRNQGRMVLGMGCQDWTLQGKESHLLSEVRKKRTEQ